LETKFNSANNTVVEAYLAPAVNRNTFQCVVVTQTITCIVLSCTSSSSSSSYSSS